jgi:hypothetical protein
MREIDADRDAGAGLNSRTYSELDRNVRPYRRRNILASIVIFICHVMCCRLGMRWRFRVIGHTHSLMTYDVYV